MKSAAEIPDNHPVKQLFRTFTERGLAQTSLRDQDIHLYLADLLVNFIFIENLYRTRDADGRRSDSMIDILSQAMEAEMPGKKAYYQHLGDYSLFMLGMFPEFLVRSRRALSPAWYADTGRAGYQIAGELESQWWRTVVFRKLADKFETCVVSLNWVREYTSDPFYQYMFRQFGTS